MKIRVARKILKQINYEKRYKHYHKHQVRKAVKTWLPWLIKDKKVRMAFYLDLISGGCHDTYRWRGVDTEGWDEPMMSYGEAVVIGEYLV